MNLEKPLRLSTSLRSVVVRPLVVKVEGEGSDDWRSKRTSLSRHEVECDVQRSVVTVFGGKLTDCPMWERKLPLKLSR